MKQKEVCAWSASLIVSKLQASGGAWAVPQRQLASGLSNRSNTGLFKSRSHMAYQESIHSAGWASFGWCRMFSQMQALKVFPPHWKGYRHTNATWKLLIQVRQSWCYQQAFLGFTRIQALEIVEVVESLSLMLSRLNLSASPPETLFMHLARRGSTSGPQIRRAEWKKFEVWISVFSSYCLGILKIHLFTTGTSPSTCAEQSQDFVGWWR